MKGLLEVDRRPFPTVPPERRRRSPRVRALVWLAAGALCATTVGVLVADQIRAQRQYDTARTALGTTRQRTTTVSAQLHELQRDLDVVKTQVGNDTTALNQDTAQLLGAQTSLSAAQAHVSQQASRITSLQTCLAGVEQALNQLATGKQSGAIAALNAVSSNCAAAEASSG
jgi:chromosome segregation ATPase